MTDIAADFPPLDRADRPRASGRQRVLVVACLTSSLVNFRYDILREIARRADVLACAPDDDPETVEILRGIGVSFQRIPMDRVGASPLADLRTLAALVRICRSFRPDVIFPYTMKPIIYGCLAARLTRVPRRVPMCTALGYVYVDPEPGLRLRVLRWISTMLYRVALPGVQEMLIYNEGDRRTFLRHRLMPATVALSRVPGSGINLDRFPQVPVPEGPPVFLMVARLLRMKGVPEYVAAARAIKRRFPDARCQLVGPFDDNPTSIRPEELERYVAEGCIEYLGTTRDIRPYLARASVFVLPSHCEGISRSVLEAMSTGRAIVTTDGIGCAEPVLEGKTGFVVPVGNADALADAMAKFAENPALAASMGDAARRHAEATFDVNKVNRILLGKLGLGNIPPRDPVPARAATPEPA